MAPKFPCRNLIHDPHMWPQFDPRLRTVKEEFDILQCEQFCQWCPIDKQHAYERTGDLRKHARQHLGKANAHRIRSAKAGQPHAQRIDAHGGSSRLQNSSRQQSEEVIAEQQGPYETAALEEEEEESSLDPQPSSNHLTPLDRLATSAEYAAADIQTLEIQITGSLLHSEIRMTFEELVRNIQNIQWQIQRLKSTSQVERSFSTRHRRISAQSTALQNGRLRPQSKGKGRMREQTVIIVDDDEEEEGDEEEDEEQITRGTIIDSMQGEMSSRKRKNDDFSTRKRKRRATEPHNTIRALGDRWLSG